MQWEIRVTQDQSGLDRVTVRCDDRWFSDAEDVFDAVGILHSQRATTYAFNDHESVTQQSL